MTDSAAYRQICIDHPDLYAGAIAERDLAAGSAEGVAAIREAGQKQTLRRIKF
jgi:hypothetical protein